LEFLQFIDSREPIIDALMLDLKVPPIHCDAAPARAGSADMRRELKRLLASAQLCKAAQASRLLTFLVELAEAGAPGAANEYAIGLAVFGRDATTYSTGEDPIVRVQMGRLRGKLAQFYAGEGGHGSDWRIEIPLGCYTPRLLPCAPPPLRLVFHGLECIGDQASIGVFSRALAEELRFRLHRQFGAQFCVAAPDQRGTEQLRQLGIGYLLDGSVRHDSSNIRTSFRLLDLARHHIAWSEQLDHANDLSIARQEHLAGACCQALGTLLRGRNSGPL
jgi:TolB-like protein